jgi:tetratricopeptide (TPR) repeat protein
MGAMRRLLLLAVVAILSAVAPVSANDEQDCFQSQKAELRIRACSEIIQRSPNDATAYHNRAVAYALAGDTDSAIADYSKVIEIAPSNATAYENRGRAYASRGDYTNAVADANKAKDLMAKATAQPAVIAPKGPKTTTIPPKAKVIPNPSNNAGSWTPWPK